MFKKKIVGSLCLLCFLVGVWIALDPAAASTIIQPAYNLVQNAGSNLLRRTTINFHGAGVTASDSGGVTDVNIPGGVTSAYNLVQQNGTPLTQRMTLNCTGAGITCSDDGLNMVTLINVPGTSGYNLVQDEGTPLTMRSTLNCTGMGITCSDDALNMVTLINVPGGNISFGAPNTNCPFTSATSVTCTHNLGTTAVVVQCFDNSTPPLNIEWNSLALTDSNTVTITFSVTQTGSCKINGTQGSGQNVTAETSTFTVTSAMNVILCNATAGTVLANLPAIATAGIGRQYTMKKTDSSASSCTLTPNGAETIDGAANKPNTTQNASFTIITDGTTGWYII